MLVYLCEEKKKKQPFLFFQPVFDTFQAAGRSGNGFKRGGSGGSGKVLQTIKVLPVFSRFHKPGKWVLTLVCVEWTQSPQQSSPLCGSSLKGGSGCPVLEIQGRRVCPFSSVCFLVWHGWGGNGDDPECVQTQMHDSISQPLLLSWWAHKSLVSGLYEMCIWSLFALSPETAENMLHPAAGRLSAEKSQFLSKKGKDACEL